MAIAKMSVAELEKFLHTEFPQAFSSGDIEMKSADGASCCGSVTGVKCCPRVAQSPDHPDGTGCAMYVVPLSAIGPAVTTSLNFLRKGAPGTTCLPRRNS